AGEQGERPSGGEAVGASDDVVQDGHRGEEVESLEGPGDTCTGHVVGTSPGWWGTLPGDGPLRGAQHTGKNVEQGGLARTVGADEPDDGSGPHSKPDVVECGESSEAYGYPFCFQKVVRHGRCHDCLSHCHRSVRCL